MPDTLDPILASAFEVNNPGLSDHAKKAIIERVDFLMGPLEQGVKQMGLGKPYAEALENATMLASVRIEDLKTAYAKSNAAKTMAELADTLGITTEQYNRLRPEMPFESRLTSVTKTAKETAGQIMRTTTVTAGIMKSI
ncbi:hypothetical protein LTR12_000459 [Friedmanniomyces endolithicus]|nr:hypothetical protein LTR12_000459 [Friedmanniomyces endolithicus]